MKDKLPKPTEEEIDQAREAFGTKYDIVIPRADLVKLVNLTKELEWWIKVGNKPISSSQITDKMIHELQELTIKTRGVEISEKEAREGAESLLVLAPMKEQQCISESMRAIVISHRLIPYEPVVEEKTAKLFKLQYETDLTQSQLEQVIQLLTRTLWFQEGLDESLEKCLDDLLLFADKQKRGKRTSGIKSHDKIRKAMDQSMERLSIPSSGWERFFKES